jgi:predicted nucleic acid-binding protein
MKIKMPTIKFSVGAAMGNERWLLDTNVISETRKKKGNPRVKAWLKAKPDVAIPFPVWYEIERGIILDPDRQHAELLREWREGLRGTDYYEPVLTVEVALKLAASRSYPQGVTSSS